ncbi:MAG: DUF4091 domain-containing protein [bacterium]|nr:DUF4091 domain-containing protein [bacterium]
MRIIFCLTLLLTSCGGGPGFEHWLVDPLVKVFPDDHAGANEAGAEPILMARNGYGTAQIAIRGVEPIPELNVEVAASGGLTVQTRWADYVPVGSSPVGTPLDEVVRPAPALFPDPLREDFPFELKADTTHAIWITLHAPADAEPGSYECEAVLSSGGVQLATVTFQARVMSATVPEKQTLQVTNWMSLGFANLSRHYKMEENSEEHWQLLENIGRVMAEHKQNVLLTPVRSLAKPVLSGGRIRYDFSQLDRWVETFEKAGLLGTIEGGHLMGRSSGYFSPVALPAYVVEGGRVVTERLEPDDPRAERFLATYLPALYDHLKEKGWTERYIQHILDEPHDREAPIYRRYAQLTHKHMPGIPTIDAVSLRQRIDFFADVCDIWVPVLSSFDHKLDVMRVHVESGGQAWYYTCVSPRGRYLNRFIDYSLLKVRLLHWFNYRHDLTGFLHWGGMSWGPRPFENVQRVINSNRTLLPAGDHAIVYPHPEKNSIFSSIRLEAMRDGIEDYELLAALSSKDPEKAKALAAAAIPHVNDYVRDPAAFRDLRRQLLEAFSEAVE